MNITFVLPGPGSTPVGGFKVVYEYANGLVRRGHSVTVVHAPYCQYAQAGASRLIYRGLVYWARLMGIKKGYSPRHWFGLEPAVRATWAPSLDARYIPEADVVFATSFETAEWAAGYPASKGRKFYLIQGDERIFQHDRERVQQTLTLPLQKIVIARWLRKMVMELGEAASYIPNGLDHQQFNIDIPPADRYPRSIMMLYHRHPYKGFDDGLAALKMVSLAVPGTQVTLFGIPKMELCLPPNFTYWRAPSPVLLRSLYNQAAIFVGPSWSEGWGLTASEATQCGAALCLTDIGGHREFAIHGVTALLSPARTPHILAQNIIELIHDIPKRIRIAQEGHTHVCQFTWENACNLLEEEILRG